MRRVVGLAAASLGLANVAALAASPIQVGQSGLRDRRYPRSMKGVPASINRNTGKPHEHKREIARRLRQAD